MSVRTFRVSLLRSQYEAVHSALGNLSLTRFEDNHHDRQAAKTPA
jgi:hypothetical protein